MANPWEMDWGPAPAAPAAPPASRQPRGLRNNNPLNLEATVNWTGMQGNDGRFAVFPDMEQGVAAADRNLQAYHQKHGINTVAGVINRWAPPNENDTGAYVATVADRLGVDPNEPLDMADPQVRRAMLDVMADVENGTDVDLGGGPIAQARAPWEMGWEAPAQSGREIGRSANGGVTVELLGPAPSTPRKATPQPPPRKPKGVVENVTGLMANLNRGLGIGDELAAGAQNLVNLATGRTKVTGDNPLEYAGNLLGTFSQAMQGQRQIEDNFNAARPRTAALARGVGNAATVALPGPAALNAIGAGGMLGGALRGAVTAAVPAAASGFLDRGNLNERLTNANISAAIGGALGGVGGAIAGRSRPAPLVAPETRVQGVADTMRDAGVDPAAILRDQTDRASIAAMNASPEAIAFQRMSQELPVPVPMTTGQLSGSADQQLIENIALRGGDGPVAATLMRGQQAMQQQALRENVDAIAARVSGGRVLPRGAAGEMVSDTLNAQRDAGKRAVDEAFKAAREADAGTILPRDQVPVLGARLREALRDVDMMNPRVQSVGRAISQFDDVGGAVQVRDLFDVRARLSKLRGDNDQMQSMAAGQAVRELDRFIDDALTNDLFSGDATSVQRWRDAIGESRRFKSLFEGGDLVNKLTERQSRLGARALAVDPADASNYIFGRADLGFAGKRGLTRDLVQLRNVLGPDSQEWAAIRGEVFQRFGAQGDGAYEGGARVFSGVKFDKAWRQFTQNNPEMARVLFSPDEISQINQFSSVAARATNPAKGGDNPPNTAVALRRLLMNVKWLKGIPFVREIADMAEQSAATAATRRAISGQLPASVPRRTPGAGLRVGAAGAIGVGAGSNQQSR